MSYKHSKLFWANSAPPWLFAVHVYEEPIDGPWWLSVEFGDGRYEWYCRVWYWWRPDFLKEKGLRKWLRNGH